MILGVVEVFGVDVANGSDMLSLCDTSSVGDAEGEVVGLAAEGSVRDELVPRLLDGAEGFGGRTDAEDELPGGGGCCKDPVDGSFCK